MGLLFHQFRLFLKIFLFLTFLTRADLGFLFIDFILFFDRTGNPLIPGTDALRVLGKIGRNRNPRINPRFPAA